MAQAALSCGLDFVFTTDMNVYPVGYDQFFYKDRQRVLVLCGEELFDPINREAPHYLSIGIEREQFNRSIAASPDEIRVLIGQSTERDRFRHFELINAQSLLNRGLETGLAEIRRHLDTFDEMLRSDLRCVGLAGTCIAEETNPFSYPELFSTACNHLLTRDEASGEFSHDKLLALRALKNGNLFIALDGLADAKGFCFTAEGNDQSFIALPGDTILLKNSITLKIRIPESCTCRLLREGRVIREWQQCKQVPYTIYEPGIYRVECRLPRRRREYDWIFSNPIYVRRG